MIKNTVVFLGFVVVYGCAISSYSPVYQNEGSVWLEYVNAEEHNFEVHMYERKIKNIDFYELNTSTPEERKIFLDGMFSFEPGISKIIKQEDYPLCLSFIKITGEESYMVANHPKKFLNSRWWKVNVYCEKVNTKALSNL